MKRLYKMLNHLFYRKLCICVDRPVDRWTLLRHWWNWRTARIAWWFHQRYCEHCAEMRKLEKERSV
jgi:hypothetical protein